MSIAALLHRHAFGVKSNVKNNIHFAEETIVTYPAGHNVVLYNTEQKTQKFIPGTEKQEGATAMCISPNRKYVAVAERGEKPIINVYDVTSLKRKKQLTTNEVHTSHYVSLCFSPDSKYLLSQGAYQGPGAGQEGWMLILWVWDKGKVAASVRASQTQANAIYECVFNPLDSSYVSVCGNGIFKLFRIADSTFKALPGVMGKREPQNYTTHTWLPDDRIIIATDSGDLLLCEAGELRMALPQSPSDGNSIDSIVPYSKGFVCGSDGGTLSIFEKSDDKDCYKHTKTFRIENNACKIVSMAMSPSEEQLLCALENNQLFSFSISNLDILKSEDMNFEPLAQSFHTSQITGLDTCIRKPLVATCSTDKSVRIWNYVDRTLELVKVFPEEAYSVAFHPSGLHVLVGFSDKLRLMNLLMDDIRSFKEFAIKACRECRFSNGGQYFAAVNGNTIQVFNTYTCENIGNLRGHNGKVRSVFWSPDDTKLFSAGMDGAVYEWRLKDFKREGENVLKTCNYTCVVCTPDGRSVFAVGSDKKLKELNEAQINKEFETGAAPLSQIVLSQSGRMLFAGSESGTIRSYKFPLSGEFQEYQCHAGAVTRLRVSYDDSYLFAVADDASLFIFDIRDKEGRAGKRDKEMLPFAEEILVTKYDLEEKTAYMAELKTKVDELTMQNEYQLRLKDLNYNEKIKEITDKFTQELEADKTKYELLLQKKNDMEMEFEEKIKQLEEKHQTQLQNLESQYQQKIMAEVERYQTLAQEKEALNERWHEQNTLLVESHERVVQELTEEYESKIQDEHIMNEKLKEEKEELIREFEETKRQLEEDADREIEELKERYETKLAAEREASLRLKGENGIMRKKFNSLQKDIEQKDEEIKTMFDKEKELRAVIANLEKDINGLKKEIKERDETIGDKEKRIYDLKKKNQELEKFKFVLDYKIKELKKQIEPREMEIADMKEQIKEMDKELERYHSTNGALELSISDLKMKLEGLQREVLKQRARNVDNENILRRVQNDLYECAQHIQDPKSLKEHVKRLYQKYAAGHIVKTEIDTDIHKEYQRQREYLEKSVESLKRKLQKDSELHRTDTRSIMQENQMLLKEINELRREVKALRQQQKALPLAAGDSRESRRGRGSARDPRPPEQYERELEMQREEIGRLRDQVDQLTAQVVHSRPVSRERLPPMEGFSERDTPVGGRPDSHNSSRPPSRPPSVPVSMPRPPSTPSTHGGTHGGGGRAGGSRSSPRPGSADAERGATPPAQEEAAPGTAGTSGSGAGGEMNGTAPGTADSQGERPRSTEAEAQE
eukprot:Rmarinus@m.11291